MKSIISQDEVKKIAALAKLTLTPQEIQKFQKQLSETLNYVRNLKVLKTDGLLSTNQISVKTNLTRADITGVSLSQDEALSGTMAKHNGYFKIKSIF